jgi:hypothetical protein
VVLQQCYSSVASVLQECYAVRMSKTYLTVMLQFVLISVTEVLKLCSGVLCCEKALDTCKCYNSVSDRNEGNAIKEEAKRTLVMNLYHKDYS